jgi:hypothetical protein
MSHYYIDCPFCQEKIELPNDEPDDLFKVVGCLNCDRTFDYEPEDVLESADTPSPMRPTSGPIA